MIKISVIIPVYNAENSITRCLDSLFAQDFCEFEAICIEDKGKDLSLSLLHQIEQKDSRVHVIENEKNMGPMYSRMVGYKMARGKYIAFLDSDDVLPKNSLSVLYELAVLENADIVSGNLKYVWGDNREKIITSTLKYGTDKISVFRSLLSCEYQHILCNKIFRRELLQDFSYDIFPGAKRGEDSCMFYQVVKNASKIVHTNQIIYFYLDNPESSSHKKLDDDGIRSLVTTNHVIESICKCYKELDGDLYRRLSKSLCALYTQGYGVNPILKNEIKKYGLEIYLSPIKMFRYFSFVPFIKLMTKRYIYPLIGKTKNE